MAYQSLYRRYRSQNFEQIKGQPHVTQALRTAIKEGRHSHAYLFSGPRGTGKTSTARVLAKALNCDNLVDGEPCTTCTSCVEIEQGKSFDLHELDAASNNKVDDIRDLIAKVALGSPGRTKVYILDEVHMLSTGAENALLKTLEEPPAHVVFVLATTEPHKVVPTIRSRTQHFEFHLLPGEDLDSHLRFVIEDAGLDVGEDGIEYALRQGGGSARDTLSALDLVAAAGGVPENSNVGHELALAIGAKDAAGTVGIVQRALEAGREPRIIGEQTLESLRYAFLASMGAPMEQLSEAAQSSATELASNLGAATITRSLESLGQALVEMRQAPDPRVPLEVTLLRLARRDGTDAAALLQRIETLESEVEALKSGASQPASGASPRATAQTAETQTAVAQGAIAKPRQQPAAPSQQTPAPQSDSEPQSRQAASKSKRGPASAARATLADTSPDTEPARPPAVPRQPPAPRPPSSEAQPPPRAPNAEAPASPSAASPATPSSTSPPSTTQDEIADNPGAESPAIKAVARSQPSTTSSISLDQLKSSFEDLLNELPQRVRARFRLGQFIGLDGDNATFGLPNSHVIGRCEEVRPDVEAALTAKFGHQVSITLAVHDGATTTSAPPSVAPTAATRTQTDQDNSQPEEAVDMSELKNAPDVATTGIDRLSEAFPGAQLVEPTD